MPDDQRRQPEYAGDTRLSHLQPRSNEFTSIATNSIVLNPACYGEPVLVKIVIQTKVPPGATSSLLAMSRPGRSTGRQREQRTRSDAPATSSCTPRDHRRSPGHEVPPPQRAGVPVRQHGLTPSTYTTSDLRISATNRRFPAANERFHGRRPDSNGPNVPRNHARPAAGEPGQGIARQQGATARVTARQSRDTSRLPGREHDRIRLPSMRPPPSAQRSPRSIGPGALIGLGNVDVTGVPGGPWTITFQGASGDAVPLLIVDDADMSNGSKASGPSPAAASCSRASKPQPSKPATRRHRDRSTTSTSRGATPPLR